MTWRRRSRRNPADDFARTAAFERERQFVERRCDSQNVIYRRHGFSADIEATHEGVPYIGCALLPGQHCLRCAFTRAMADSHGNVQAKFRSESAREFPGLIESTARQSGVRRRHRNDQFRIGLFIPSIGQSCGQRSSASKVSVILQSLDQRRAVKFVFEWRDDTIEMRAAC